MRGRMERCFARHPNAANPYARALLLGETPPAAPPSRHAIDLVCTDAAAYLESCEPGSYGGFTLSNVLDGAPAEYRDRLLAAVERAARPGAVRVLRSFGEPPAPSPTNLAAADRSMLWGVVEVQPFDGRRECAAGVQAPHLLLEHVEQDSGPDSSTASWKARRASSMARCREGAAAGARTGARSEVAGAGWSTRCCRRVDPCGARPPVT